MRRRTRTSREGQAGRRLTGSLVFFASTALLALILFVFREIAFRNPPLADVYAQRVYAPLAAAWTWPVSRFSFSLTESAAVLGPPILLLLLILGLIRLIRSRGQRLRLLLRTGARFFGVLCISFSLFILFHGLNYARSPLAGQLGLEVRQHTVDELEDAVRRLAKAAVRERARLPEQRDGTADIGPLNRLWSTAFEGWDRADDQWPVLRSPVRARPKGVLLSHYWSYTQIVGLYMPLLVEPNVNIDQPAFMIPVTAAHELSHARGLAREGDSDFAALLSCLHHPDPAWRYSGLISAWKSASRRLWEEDRDRWAQAYRDELSEAVIRDLESESLYWSQFETPVASFSEKVNDTYLKANREDLGVKSYGTVVDLILAFLDTDGSQDLLAAGG